MPIISCPKCPAKLRVADGTTGNVRCPKCSTVFPATPPAQPAFEVVEDDEPAPVEAKPKPAPVKAKADFDFDDDDDDRPRKKKNRRRDDDDDDDEDDRPRSRRRRDDDDDDDDRPRKKKGRRRDDDDDDYDGYDRGPKGSRAAFGAAKTGSQLVGISLWLYLGTFALLIFFLLLAWAGVSIPNGLMIVIGLLGLSNWIVGLIGLGFCIAGPAKARGLAIAATAVAGVHLIMGFVIANHKKSIGFSSAHVIQAFTMMNKATARAERMEEIQKEKDPKRQREMMEEFREDYRDDDSGFDSSDMRWGDLATMLPMSDQLIAVLAYDSDNFDDYLLALLGGLLEVARLILVILVIGAIAGAARNSDAAGRSTTAVIVAGATTVGAILAVLLLRVIVDSMMSDKVTSLEEAKSKGETLMMWTALFTLLVYLCHLAALFLPSFTAMDTAGSCRRKAR